MVRHLFIIRHGNTFDKGDIVRRVGLRSNLNLSESGQAQARALGHYFQGYAIGKIVCSELKRTYQTAKAIAVYHSDLRVEIDPRLNEIDYGSDDGKPETQVIARLGQAALEAWDTRALVPEGWPVDTVVLKQNWQVLLGALRDANHENTLLITSNGVARFALPFLKYNPESLKGQKLKTGAFAEINLESREILRWNVRPKAT